MQRKLLAYEATQRNVKCDSFTPLSAAEEEELIAHTPFLTQPAANLHEGPKGSYCLLPISSRKTGRYQQCCYSSLRGKSAVSQASKLKASTFLPVIYKTSNTLQFNISFYPRIQRKNNENSCSPHKLNA